MNNQDRYDEISNLIDTIDVLLNDINSKDIKEDLEYLKYSYIDEQEELEENLNKEYAEEEREMNIQYERSRF